MAVLGYCPVQYPRTTKSVELQERKAKGAMGIESKLRGRSATMRCKDDGTPAFAYSEGRRERRSKSTRQCGGAPPVREAIKKAEDRFKATSLSAFRRGNYFFETQDQSRVKTEDRFHETYFDRFRSRSSTSRARDGLGPQMLNPTSGFSNRKGKH
ncbi:hypothetical protein Hypma_009879 [Hypsizygus marmoreus]|uniref:Uncharacterized protein n=1 Tax=Hypsizygus marmoreus TaxID=39966 RepID=A0A369JLK4_HYPMA|nr:hypothetical protein Hypma_009879 [Hypsizygus marmoreus]